MFVLDLSKSIARSLAPYRSRIACALKIARQPLVDRVGHHRDDELEGCGQHSQHLRAVSLVTLAVSNCRPSRSHGRIPSSVAMTKIVKCDKFCYPW